MKQMARPEWDDHRLDLSRKEQVQIAIAIPLMTLVIWAVLLLLSIAGPA